MKDSLSDELQGKSELFKALAKFHENLVQPKKNAENPYFRNNYVTLEGVQKAIDDAAKGTGITYTQLVYDTDNGKTVQTIMIHSSGQVMRSGTLTLRPTKSDPQGIGSAITYAKRYQLAAMFGISSDIDDDGNKASAPKQQNNRHQRAPQSRRPRQANKQPSLLERRKGLYSNAIGNLSRTLNMDYNQADSDVKGMAKKEQGWANAKTVEEQLAICINVANKLLADSTKPAK